MNLEASVELLSRAREGSRGALDELFGRCSGKLLALIRLRLGPTLRGRLESRDILQAVLLRAFTRIDHLKAEGASSLMAWLARIVENEIRDRAEFHGRQRRDRAAEVELGAVDRVARAHVRSALTEVLWGERQSQLEGALEALEPDHREVILLRKLEELPWSEVAARLGRSPDACRMLLARAMTALTLELGAGEHMSGAGE